MRRQPFVIHAVGVLAASAISIGTAYAQTTAVGPYYATPSWDQKIACTSPSNCARFVVLSNWNSEAVLDRETGLVWQRDLTTVPIGWADALAVCIERRAGGRKGWRLPTVEELNSLLESSVGIPSLPVGHPFIDVQLDEYWSATSSVKHPDSAWTVHFGSGLAVPRNKDPNIDTGLFWCVRGGQGVNPQ